MNHGLRKYVLLDLGLLVACHSAPPLEPSLKPAAGETIPGEGAAGGAPPSSAAGGAPNHADGAASGGIAAAGATPTGGAAGEPPDMPDPAAGTGSATEPGPFDGPSRCTSEVFRDPNESEAPEMNPGFACIACHAAMNAASGEGDAPIFTFAGTLYPTAHEPNSCTGRTTAGAEVVLDDAAGTELRAVANTSGNFLLEDARLTPPFSAKVVFEGRQRTASTPHGFADCNACHTERGDHGAPGRVVLP